jgi:hypothetical protein
LSIWWWVLSSADTKFSTEVTNFIQESLVFIEHLVSAFFCWYKSFHPSYIISFKRVWWSLLELLVGAFFCWYKVFSNQGTKLIQALSLCLFSPSLSVFSLSVSLRSFLCFLYWAFWRALLLSISLKFDGNCLSESLSLFWFSK